MKLLILGGTQFVGRHITEAVLAAGHNVTLFHRGQTNPDLFPTVTHLTGDRDGNLEALKNKKWDVVIDTCGYVPRIVKASAELLKDAVEQYIFISTISVYADKSIPHQDESGELEKLADDSVEEVTGETYGGLKVLCEKVAEEIFPGKTLNVRLGLVVGPHDHTDRFTYWPHRVAKGGEVLAPGSPETSTQHIDVRDAAAWIIHMAEKRQSGVYNLVRPPYTFGELLDISKKLSGGDAAFTWVSELFLIQNDVQPFSQLPLWLPPEMQPYMTLNSQKAIAAGLKNRPLEDTVKDVLAWDATRDNHEFRSGLSPEQEADLLDKWHNPSDI